MVFIRNIYFEKNKFDIHFHIYNDNNYNTKLILLHIIYFDLKCDI